MEHPSNFSSDTFPGDFPSSRGFFVTFEGSEGCGKSTQVRLLDEWLRKMGVSTVVTREPGGTLAGDAIRHLLQHAPEGKNLCPEAELFLFSASRAQLLNEVIRPALAAGKVVICDRFHDSTTVYQGVARKLAGGMTRAVNDLTVGQTMPDVTFLMDMPAEEAFARLGGRALDRMESEPIAFYQAVREGYLSEAKMYSSRFFVVDASLEAAEVAKRIQVNLVSRFPQHFSRAT